MAEDCSQGDVWKVLLCSGENAHTTEWVQKNCLEEYLAPTTTLPYSRVYSMKKDLGRCVGEICTYARYNVSSEYKVQVI